MKTLFILLLSIPLTILGQQDGLLAVVENIEPPVFHKTPLEYKNVSHDLDILDESDSLSYIGTLYNSSLGQEIVIIEPTTELIVAVGQVEDYQNKQFTGYVKYLWPNGNIESEGRIVDGIKIGEWKRFKKNGEARSSKFYTQKRFNLLKKYCAKS
ncbi:hypothetical protein [Sanyastnella coralliicola]|uniref:hypothetical protein n=1 Tax=Sanyastnella coralliicola TaxID=3069118 RepID=UPI0027BAC472|nr:hypothetical protein [Longitalea sp. SCSIO 12813]